MKFENFLEMIFKISAISRTLAVIISFFPIADQSCFLSRVWNFRACSGFLFTGFSSYFTVFFNEFSLIVVIYNCLNCSISSQDQHVYSSDACVVLEGYVHKICRRKRGIHSQVLRLL